MIVKTALDMMRTLPRCWQKPIPQGHLDIEAKYLKQLEPVIDKCDEGVRLSELGEYVLDYLTNAGKDRENFDETLCILLDQLAEAAVIEGTEVTIDGDQILEFIKRHSMPEETKFDNKCPKECAKKCNKKCANKCTKKCCKNGCQAGGMCITKMGVIKAKSPEELVDKLLAALSDDDDE